LAGTFPSPNSFGGYVILPFILTLGAMLAVAPHLIEDARGRGHTLNPVPLAAVGPAAERLQRQVHSLTDVTPALLSLFFS